MQNWTRTCWLFFPTIVAFFLLSVLLQLVFLTQVNGLVTWTNTFLSVLHLLLLFSVYWTVVSILGGLFPNRIRLVELLLYAVLTVQVIGSICCDQYYLYAHEPLDEAFLLFDWTELWMIADVEHRLNIVLMSLFLSVMLLPWIVIKWVKKKSKQDPSSTLKKCTPFLIIAFALYVFVPFQVSTKNRFNFFVGRLVHAGFFGQKDIENMHITPADFKDIPEAFYNVGKQIDPVYPCLHEFKQPSVLSPLLQQTSTGKPPHICIVIVESMSSDLFGERGSNTGVLMPFLDSLSKRSLYFPNAFSTYQRTHNVLPAVLTSVPNTVDGNVFQQIPFPRHYSLFNLLKKNYRFQFNCGVPYDYLNMGGFMQQYKGVQLLQTWDKKHQIHKEQVGNAWGYPDEDLFGQAQEEARKHPDFSRSQLKVFLTISSHDPFLYPNKDGWKKFVEEKTEQIKDRKLAYLVKHQAAEFGSFSYTDSCLHAFFQKEQRSAHYRNTIYIITGDHGTELYRRNPLSKYQVPIVIYSPLLKHGFQSNAVVSHNDIAPTLLNYLKSSYHVSLPDEVPFMGKELVLSTAFEAKRKLFFTTNKLTTSELMDDSLVLLQNRLYLFNEQLDLEKVQQATLLKRYKKVLKQYQLLSHYTILQNHLINATTFEKWVDDSRRIVPLFHLQQKKLRCFNRMTLIGGKNNIRPKGHLRITFQTTVSLKHPRQINKLPALVLQAKRSVYFSDKWTINRKVRPHLIRYDARHKRAIVRYALEFQPKKRKNPHQNNAYFVYLCKEETSPIEMHQLTLSFEQMIRN